MSETAPQTTALKLLDGAARILLDVAAVAAKEHRERIPAPVMPEAERAGFALQAVLRQAHNDGVKDEDLFQALSASVAMFMVNQRTIPTAPAFLGEFNRAVVQKLPRRPQRRPH